jgi:cytoskeleton protein RodZ
MPEQSNSNVAEFFSPGPGERLRAARLSMGYDLAKLASELHLTTPVVQALEADDYSDIGARVFVRGYLRNYARIVGVPVDSILRQFDEKWPDDGARQYKLRESPKLPADGGPGRGWAGLMTWLVVIGIVVLFLMWWRGYLDGVMPQQIRSTSVVDGENATALPALPPVEEGLAFLEADNLPADGSLRMPPPPPDVAPEAETAELGAEQAAPLLTDSVESPASTAEAGASDRGAPPAIASTQPAAADAAGTGTPVSDGGKQIVMSFSAPCWVDVRDSEREFKLFGEMPKGTRKVLGGEPPYKMVIGNARAVSITVNGEPFDLTPYAKGNVARFTLDP